MRQRTRSWLAGLLCGIWLLSTLVIALAATYPYETTCVENVNMRAKASESAGIMKRLKAGDKITVTATTGQFYKIKVGKDTGYAMRMYVDGTSPDADTAPRASATMAAPPAVDKYPYDTITIDAVKLRKKAEAEAPVIVRIPRDSVIKVLDVLSSGFAKVTYNGKTGYVVKAFVNLANIPVPTPEPGATLPPNADKYPILKKGSSGDMVKALQEALTELTYYSGKIDAKYGAQTETAVNACKKRNGLTQDGIADQAFQLLLYEGTPKNPAGYRKILKTMPPIGGFAIRSGNVGTPVERLQARLKELGFYLGEINGTCDKATVQGIKDFQELHDLRVTGEADSTTQNALYGATAMAAGTVVTPTPKPVSAPPKGTVRAGDRGADAKAVQQRLKDLEFYTGKVDGNFGAASVKALKSFQTKSALEADGVCGSATRAALFNIGAATAKATAIPIAPVTQLLTPETTVTIQAGSRGNAVRNMQQRLMDLGYYSSRLDGVYLEDDITAVRAFQKANGLKVDGKAGFETQSKMYGDNAVRGNIITTPGITLRYGSMGSDVIALQNRLIELGYLTGTADGQFGIGTKTAVMAFQKANKLSKDGVVGAKTQEVLYGATVVKMTIKANTTLKEGVVSAAVKDLQNRLIFLGYLTGTADGKFGSKTTLALMEFQKRNSLIADGIAGNLTIASLNNYSAKQAAGAIATPKPGALTLSGAPSAANVRYGNWYNEVRDHSRAYPNVTIYDFVTGISWQVNIFSVGAHADAEPLTANDTANMNRAFGGKTTWTAKAVWVVYSDGRVYMGSTHNTPHETYHIRDNNFSGHLCIHFPRSEEQVNAIGPYATSHQKAIDLGWQATIRGAGLFPIPIDRAPMNVRSWGPCL